MISYRTGNLLDTPGIPVIPVNCVGVMGKGLAKQAAEKWPWMEAEYKRRCKARLILEGGDVSWVYDGKQMVCLFATKKHWKAPSEIAWIASGLARLRDVATSETVMNLPKLGCGLGGLDWADVKPLMVKYLSGAPGEFNIYE